MRKLQAKPGVLLVEDDPIQAECCKRLLAEFYDVFVAPNTVEAENILARTPDIKILLCDHEMDGEQGLTYCRRLQFRESPLIRILVTGHSEPNFLVEALNSNALFHYLLKPYDRESLLKVLKMAHEAYDERQHELEYQEVSQSGEEEKLSLFGKLIHWGQVIFGLGSMILVTILIVLVVAAIVGVGLLLLLYFLKSFLGIDIFKDSHLSDWF
ncbi:response regulator [Kiritimatiellaeota bacterium B1221]|nr:response regulator [Kiritimatiellaeota bacterium B1221]